MLFKEFFTNKKLACITLDFERDYGDRVGEFNIINNRFELNELKYLFSKLNIPISVFLTTDVLEDYPSSIELAKSLGNDFHSHSHSHNTKNPDSEFEICHSKLIFEKFFNSPPLGYRAPQGVLQPGDLKLLEKYDYKFSSSVFPSFRPGKFNNLNQPINPIIYENGFIEMPFSVIKKIRYTYSLSYIKLMGLKMNKLLISSFGLPNIVVFDSHLHDYIVNEESLNQLPIGIKYAFNIRRNFGKLYLTEAIKILKSRGYEFITMTELYKEINSQN